MPDARCWPACSTRDNRISNFALKRPCGYLDRIVGDFSVAIAQVASDIGAGFKMDGSIILSDE